MPSSVIYCLAKVAIEDSTRGKKVSAASRTVTLLPSLLKSPANSRPIFPPPRMPRRLGNVERF